MRKVQHYLMLGVGLSAVGVFASGALDPIDVESQKVGFKAANSLSLGVYTGTYAGGSLDGKPCTVVVRDNGKYYFSKDRTKMLEISIIAGTPEDKFRGVRSGHVTQVTLGQPPERSSGTDDIPVNPTASELRQFAEEGRTLPNPVARVRSQTDKELVFETRTLSYRFRDDIDKPKQMVRARDANGDIVRQTGAGTPLALTERQYSTSIDLKAGGLLDRITLAVREGTTQLEDKVTKTNLGMMSNDKFQDWKKNWDRPTSKEQKAQTCEGLKQVEKYERTWTELPAAASTPAPAAPAAKPVEVAKVAAPALAAAVMPPLAPALVKASKADVKKVEKKDAPAAEAAPAVPAGPHTEGGF